MLPAADRRPRIVTLALVMMAMTLAWGAIGCGAGPKKKVASAEEEPKADEPPPRWESAGETAPPEKPATPTAPPASATTASAPATSTTVATPPKPSTPTRGKPVAANKPAASRKGAKPQRAAGGATGKTPAVADDELLQPVLTLDSVSKPPKSEPEKVATVTPAPPPTPTSSATSATVAATTTATTASGASAARAEPTVVAATATPAAPVMAPPPKVEASPKTESPSETATPLSAPVAAIVAQETARLRKIDRASRADERARPPPERAAVVERGRPRASAREAEREREEPIRELHARIGGKTIVFRGGTLLGNRRHGYAIQAFETVGSTRGAEVDFTIEVDVTKRGPLPVRVIYVQVVDDDPKNPKGVKPLDCRGRGEIVLESLPSIPKRLPLDPLDVGDAWAKLATQVTCTHESSELGTFFIEGRVPLRVLVIPADM